jgi:hypothetical protein
VNKVKPWFKRFEMHGNLPTVLQHGIVVSASEIHKQTKGGRIETHANENPQERWRERNDRKYPENDEQI